MKINEGSGYQPDVDPKEVKKILANPPSGGSSVQHPTAPSDYELQKIREGMLKDGYIGLTLHFTSEERGVSFRNEFIDEKERTRYVPMVSPPTQHEEMEKFPAWPDECSKHAPVKWKNACRERLKGLVAPLWPLF